ncbi:MAG: hypothetical protein COX66_17050 [Elusimicrobia bacterium CG_4_10_14_0_2_um_filter_63_34]|nr:MAG: hypothetical protein COX66_17050 [Elusimicrobia bacterium CG_4_10_14_0_2_um_filter_63_34]
MLTVSRSVYPSLLAELDRPEVSILLGPRQVGKTHLLGALRLAASERGLRTHAYNLEIPHDLIAFNKPPEAVFDLLTRDVDAVFIDEFHYLANASRIFKAVYDSGRRVKIYASGSSALEMHKHLKESLAGRRLVTRIAPLNCDEARAGGIGLDALLRWGGLPGLLRETDSAAKERLLADIVETYIQKDVKSLVREENIRAFNHLLLLLAESQGSLISENSLAKEVGLTARTINQHLSILEKTYVCRILPSYARGLAGELKKSKKAYLFDLGVRNAMLRDFSAPDARADRGALRETFAFLEIDRRLRPNMELRFWRDVTGREVDFVVLKDRRPLPVEVKSSLVRPETPPAVRTFLKAYRDAPEAIVLCDGFEGDGEAEGRPVRFRPLTALGSELDRLGY